ncbi:MAG: oxd, partial [Panacagrimonas sp.]
GQFAAGDDGPRHHDLVGFRDAAGYDNRIAVAYQDDRARYERWIAQPPIAAWWNDDARLDERLGYVREVMMPRVEQFETLYAFRDALPGVGAVMDRIGGEIEEHGYWGSMRDRFPASQTDWLSGRGALGVQHGQPALGGRVVIATCTFHGRGRPAADVAAVPRGVGVRRRRAALRVHQLPSGDGIDADAR